MTRNVQAERVDIDRITAGRTVCTMFDDTIRRYPDDAALRWQEGGEWMTISWREYGDAVRRVSMGLRSAGFGAGSLGMILARNVPEHLIADLGIVHCGGAAISVYNTLAPEQLEYVANHSRASVAFVEDDHFLRKLLAIRPRLPHLRLVVLMRGSPDHGSGWVAGWPDLMARGGGTGGDFESGWRAVRPEDMAALIYTSGTTGPPKGVVYTHRNVVWTTESGWRSLGISERQRMVSYLPLAHIAERFASHWASVYRGDRVHLCPDQASLVPTLRAVHPTFFVGVPRVWEKFQAAITAGIAAEPDDARRQAVQAAVAASRHVVAAAQAGQEPPPQLVAAVERAGPVFTALRRGIGLEQCECAVTSTAPLALDVHEFFAAIGLPLVEVWGMSEVTGPGTVVPRDAPRIGSVGMPLIGAETRLADDGELLIRGGLVMAGYHRAPEHTAEAIDEEGWLHTGDIATIDADGYHWIVDRKKELMITAAGKNVSPANIESLIKHHPLVDQAVVVGDRRRYVTALVVIDREAGYAWARAHGVDAEPIAELVRHPELVAEIQRAIADANTRLSRPEQVKRFAILPVEWTVDSEEVTPTQKLRRRVIEKRYAATVEALYGESPTGHSVEEGPAPGTPASGVSQAPYP
jgi:long-chain acyl-CoA synthetase